MAGQKKSIRKPAEVFFFSPAENSTKMTSIRCHYLAACMPTNRMVGQDPGMSQKTLLHKLQQGGVVEATLVQGSAGKRQGTCWRGLAGPNRLKKKKTWMKRQESAKQQGQLPIAKPDWMNYETRIGSPVSSRCQIESMDILSEGLAVETAPRDGS